MAQANVAREPSMDEILASIRRIIESNDPPQAGAQQFMSDEEEHPAPYGGDDDIHLTIDDGAGSPSGFKAPSSSETNTAFPMPDRLRAEPAVYAEPPLSLADVAARVRAASERHAVTRETVEPQPQPVRAVAAPDLPVSSPTTTARMGGAAAAKPAEAANSVVSERREQPAPEPAGVPEAAADTKPAPANDDLAVSSLPAIAEREVISLVSPVVGQKVAQSFESLALAVDEERRSFDEIAEEMLRPMLREWLDDNLPTLVERLVREEIERVARGPRR